MSKKLIALDDGHGMETPGKRTPSLPDGHIMHENEFNRRVVQLLDGLLKRCGFDTLLVAPYDADTPLKTRTDAANKAKADLYVSVHANAIGVGWNGTRGIETFHFAGSKEGQKVARIIHRNLMAGTRLPDRGVKSQNFHVLRETNMPAVLVECAFMTNQDDARLLLSENYRVECAEELARGICEYFCVPFVPAATGVEKVSPPPKEPPKMDVKEATAAIQSLQKLWFLVGDKEKQEETHRVADYVRAAAGIPLT